MAYASKDLSVISYANGFTLWHYATQDGGADLLEADYFANASDLLREGDMILANSDVGDTIASQMFAVGKVETGNVSLNLLASTE